MEKNALAVHDVRYISTCTGLILEWDDIGVDHYSVKVILWIQNRIYGYLEQSIQEWTK